MYVHVNVPTNLKKHANLLVDAVIYTYHECRNQKREERSDVILHILFLISCLSKLLLTEIECTTVTIELCM